MAVGLAEGAAIREVDESIARPGQRGADPAAHQLRPQQAPDRERDVLLGEVPGKVPTGVPGVHATMAGIDDDGVPEPQAGQRVRRGGGWGGGRSGGGGGGAGAEAATGSSTRRPPTPSASATRLAAGSQR